MGLASEGGVVSKPATILGGAGIGKRRQYIISSRDRSTVPYQWLSWKENKQQRGKDITHCHPMPPPSLSPVDKNQSGQSLTGSLGSRLARRDMFRCTCRELVLGLWVLDEAELLNTRMQGRSDGHLLIPRATSGSKDGRHTLPCELPMMGKWLKAEDDVLVRRADDRTPCQHRARLSKG
jgi:hypothetical protein